MSLTEVKTKNDRAIALRDRYFSTVAEMEDALYTEDAWKLDRILADLKDMKIEIEYITRM